MRRENVTIKVRLLIKVPLGKTFILTKTGKVTCESPQMAEEAAKQITKDLLNTKIPPGFVVKGIEVYLDVSPIEGN